MTDVCDQCREPLGPQRIEIREVGEDPNGGHLLPRGRGVMFCEFYCMSTFLRWKLAVLGRGSLPGHWPED